MIKIHTGEKPEDINKKMLSTFGYTKGLPWYGATVIIRENNPEMHFYQMSGSIQLSKMISLALISDFARERDQHAFLELSEIGIMSLYFTSSDVVSVPEILIRGSEGNC